jgi:2-polyprenyl-6-methoxyphenol hydroxylase-like FAD-dependent oxidoreductase
MVPIVSQRILFGLVTFREDPIHAAARLWPILQFHTTGEYVFWGLLVQRQELAIADDELHALPGPDLLRLILELGVGWPGVLRMLIEQCQPEQTFVLKLRYAKPIEQWQTTNITLLGDAIHAMPPTGSGANTALRDASLLTRSLISAANLGTPLYQALRDYESEMVRYGYNALRASLQASGNRSLDQSP